MIPGKSGTGHCGVVPLAVWGAELLALGDTLALLLPRDSRVKSPAHPSADGDGGGSLGASPWEVAPPVWAQRESGSNGHTDGRGRVERDAGEGCRKLGKGQASHFR